MVIMSCTFCSVRRLKRPTGSFGKLSQAIPDSTPAGRRRCERATSWIANCATGFPFQQIAELVLQYPVDLSARDCQGLTPLQTATLNSSSDNVDLLRSLMENTSKLDLDTPVNPGGSILHRICGTKKNGIEDLLSLYLSDIATSTSKDQFGRTALMQVSQAISTSSLADQLIEMAAENVEFCDCIGHDVLYYSCVWINDHDRGLDSPWSKD